MSSPIAGSRRLVSRNFLRAAMAVAIAVALLGAPATAKPVSASGDAWYDGGIVESVITNCGSIIWGDPYLEYGVGAFVGYLADPYTSRPGVNQTYYLRIAVSGLGNACSGQWAWPQLVLPRNTSLDTASPMYCLYDGFSQGICPTTSALAGSFNSVYGGYAINPTSGSFWGLPQGHSWEFQVPVKSSTTLTNEVFGAKVVIADGNANPTLVATQNVFVFSGTGTPKPVIVYPTPATTAITRTSATSYANIYTGGLAGTVHFQLGTTSAYGLYQGDFHLDAGAVNWQLFDDWTPTVLTPDTLYHFRMWFDPDNASVANAVGTDQTFRTLGAATSFSAAGLAGGQPGGTPQTLTVTAKDATGTTATGYRGTVQLSSTDPNAALPPAYTFTAADNGVHTFSLRLMSAGTQSVTVRDRSAGAITGTQGGVSVTTTVTAPTATITAQSAWRASLPIPVAWNGANGAVNYDVRYRKAGYSGTFGSPALLKSATTLKATTLTGAPGTTYCFAARSRAATGAVSAWTTETCTAVPLDERSMTKSSGWTAGTGSAYYKGTYLRTTTKNAKLTRTAAQAKRIAIVATTCATCGKVNVYLGATLLKTVSLYSSTTKNKKLISVASFASVRSGTISVKVITSGKKVLIDGLVISKS